MSTASKEPARDSSLTITDCVMRSMTDFGERDFTRCVIIAMTEDGCRRYIYSNARSEPEMFGMVRMACEDWASPIEEEED